jgi:cytochrome c553
MNEHNEFNLKRSKPTMTTRLLITAMFIMLLAAGTVQAGGDVANGQALSSDCADCHGEDGKGDEDSPALAGLDEAYHVEQLKAFASGERVDEDEMMGMYAEDLSEQDMADLAAYYATLK